LSLSSSQMNAGVVEAEIAQAGMRMDRK